MVSQIRKELIKEKAKKEQITTEAAHKWVEKNIILLNEKIDRKAIKRLTVAINKFDQEFGPFKDRIPTLGSNVSRAEEDLQSVLVGKVNDKTASDMLARMSFLYSTFSDFFNQDLPVILNTPLFTAPRENPSIRLDSLQPPTGGKYDPKAIRAAFQHALEPTKEEQKLLNRIYRKKNIPLIDSAAIANEMLGLTFEELQGLTQIKKIPMVATSETPEIENESVDIKKKLNEETVLQEAGLDNEKFDKLIKSFEQVRNVFNPFATKMPETKKVLDSIEDKLRETQGSLTAGAMDKVAALFGRNVEADILNSFDTFKKFLETWDNIRRILGDKSRDEMLNTAPFTGPTSKIPQQIRNILIKALSKGFLSFKKQVLSPETFIDEIMTLTPNEIDGIVQKLNLPPTEEVDPTGTDQEINTEKPGGGSQPDLKQIAQDIGEKKGFSQENIDMFQSTLQTIINAGYNIIPKK